MIHLLSSHYLILDRSLPWKNISCEIEEMVWASLAKIVSTKTVFIISPPANDSILPEMNSKCNHIEKGCIATSKKPNPSPRGFRDE